MEPIRAVVLAAMLLIGTTAARSEDVWSVTGEKTTAGVKSLEDGAVVLAGPEDSVARVPLADIERIAWHELLDWHELQIAKLHWVLELAGGDRLCGELKGWSDGGITLTASWKQDGDEVVAPIDLVRSMRRAGDEKIDEALKREAPPSQHDVALVRQGDEIRRIEGDALGLAGDALRFRFDGEDRSIALERVAALLLAGRSAAAPSGPYHRLTLRYGVVLCGEWLALTDDALLFRTNWDAEFAIPPDGLGRLEVLNGRLAFLSDLPPARVEQTPFFDRPMPYRVNQAFDGRPIRLGERAFDKGLAMHARARLEYDLGGGHQRLLGSVGFEQPGGALGRADLRVLADGRTLFERLDARGADPPTPLDLDVTSVRRLSLEVDFGEEQDVGDRVLWGNMRLLRPAQATVEASP